MAEMNSGEIQLFCVGDARIVTQSTIIDPSAEVIFGAAVYLILHRSEKTSRKYLQELLWPDATAAAAAHRLRQTLLRLRRLGFQVEADGKSRVFVNSHCVKIDVEEQLGEGVFQDSRLRLDLPVFASFAPTFSPAFNDWLDLQKARIASAIVRVLIERIKHSRAEGRWEMLERDARALLVHAPDNEEGTLALAESLAMRGDKIEAVRVLDRYLAEVGDGLTDLRVPANTMRKRILHRLPSRPSNAPAGTPMLGREEHMRRLVSMMISARDGTCEACVIRGEPGIGKSRLISEFLNFASLQGFAAHRVCCRSSDSDRPLSLILDMLPLLRGMRGAIGSSPDTLALLDALGTHRPSDSGGRARLTVTARASSRLDTALTDIIEAVSEDSPILFAIEDCHWLDDLSASVIERVIARLKNQRVLFLFTTRSLGDDLLVGSIQGTDSIRLQALSPGSSSEIIQTIVSARGRRTSDAYLVWATRVAEGNPFFLHELANHWVETGSEQSVPASVTAFLGQRLSRLDPSSLQVLQACSVLENHSTVDNVEAVLGYQAHELLSAINELVAAGMIAVSEPESAFAEGGRLNSRHDLLSETALLLLSPPARAYLHRRAAKALGLRIQANGDVSALWSCAKHWQLAGDGVQAFRLANSCAQHLLEAELPSEAGDAYARALEYCATDADRLTIVEGQARASYQSSDWAKVLSFGNKAKQIKRILCPSENRHDDLELMLRRAEWQSGNWNNILTDSLDCLSCAEANIPHRLNAGVMALMIMTSTGDSRQAEQTYTTMMAMCSPCENRDLKLQASMIFNTAWGSLDEAVSAAIELVAEQRKKKDIGELFRAHCNAAITLRVAGKFEQASDQLHEALALADRHKIHLSKARAIPMLAHMSIEIGRLAEAQTWLESLRDCAQATDDQNAKTEINTIEARLALSRGEKLDITNLVENDLAELRSDQLPHKRAYWKALRVAAQLGRNGVVTREAISDLEDEHMRTRDNVFQAFTTFALYAGLVSLGRERKASRLLDEYVSFHRREPWPPPKHILESLLAFVHQEKRPRFLPACQ